MRVPVQALWYKSIQSKILHRYRWALVYQVYVLPFPFGRNREDERIFESDQVVFVRTFLQTHALKPK